MSKPWKKKPRTVPVMDKDYLVRLLLPSPSMTDRLMVKMLTKYRLSKKKKTEEKVS